MHAFGLSCGADHADSRQARVFAAIARGERDLERAARLWGAAEALRILVGAAQQPFDRTDYNRHVTALRSDLAEAVLSTAWAEGGRMTVEQAVAYASESAG